MMTDWPAPWKLSNLDYCDVDLGATIIPAQGPLLKDGPIG
jgi:hypothetical protein